MEPIKLTPQEISPVIEVLAEAAIPTIVWGNPGRGKTAYFKNWCEKKGYEMLTMVGSQMDPTDVGGYPLPLPDMSGVSYVSPDWFRRILHDATPRPAPIVDPETGEETWPLTYIGDSRAVGETRKWALFLDELPCTPPSVQAGLFKLIQDREVNNEFLPDSTLIFAAGNGEDISTSEGVTEPMQTRFAHLEWVGYRLKEVGQMRIDGWPLPSFLDLPEFSPENQFYWDQLIAHLADSYPAWEDDLEHGGECAKEGRGYPVLRSWSNLSKALAFCGDASSIDLGLLTNLAASLVGTSTGVAFADIVREFNLPDPEDWIADPDGINVSGMTSDEVFATLTGVGSAVVRQLDQTRWNAGLKVVTVVSTQVQASTCIPLMDTLMRNRTIKEDGRQKQIRVDKTLLPDLKPYSELFQRIGIGAEGGG